MNSPSQQLASQILDRLIKEKLLDENARTKLLAELSEGKLRAEDWRLAIEMVQPKESKK
jgi:hypothetical protein